MVKRRYKEACMLREKQKELLVPASLSRIGDIFRLGEKTREARKEKKVKGRRKIKRSIK